MSDPPSPRVFPAFLDRPPEERRLGPFLLVRQLGRGGFAPVWLAEESYDGKKLRDVAIKLFFLPEGIAPGTTEAARWREEILEEARALCRVEHPNVVRFYTIQQDDASGVVGLAMEYAAGKSLDICVRQEGRLDERTVVEIGVDVAWALGAVHNAGLVHRDIKPANIIQGASGYKLIDFGIVAADPGVRGLPPSSRPLRIDVDPISTRAVLTRDLGVPAIDASTLGLAPTLVIGAAGSPLRATGLPTLELATHHGIAPLFDRTTAPPLIGTLGYIAPECFESGARATPASDIYSLGVTLFSLLTGSLPVALGPGGELPADWYIARRPPPRLESMVTMRTAITSGLSDLTHLLLDPDPAARPRYADWVAREFELLRSKLGPAEAAVSRRSYSNLPPTQKAPRSRSTALYTLLAHEARAPEPLLPLFAEVERACGGDDPTEAGRALGELALAVVRYAFALGLALLAATPDPASAAEGMSVTASTSAGSSPPRAPSTPPGPSPPRAPSRPPGTSLPRAPVERRRYGALLEQLRSAARPTHSSWCYLVRSLQEAIATNFPEVGEAFAFAEGRALADRIGGLLRGMPTAAAVEQGIQWMTSLLDAAAPLLSAPVRVSRWGPSLPTVEMRDRDRVHEPMPEAVDPLRATADGLGRVVAVMDEDSAGAPHVLLDRRWIQLSPWLPFQDGRQLLPEAPAAPGKPWRSSDPETGERCEDPELDQAVRRLSGEDPDIPRELCQSPPLVGRDEALSVLSRLAAEVRSGGVRVVVLTGPLGIGRTRLLEAAIEQAGYEPHRVLRMGCSPERKSPLRPLLRALEALRLGSGSKLGLIEEASQRAVLPSEIQRANQATEVLEGVEDALAVASAEGPLLLAIDDIQWADTHTLELLKLLIERADVGGSGRVLVICTARNEPNPGPPLRALLSKVRAKVRPSVRHVALVPLTPAETAILVQAVSPVGPELERAVVRGSGGVPFFVVHALLVWREKGAIAWRQGAWHAVDERVLEEDVPGVADLLEARIESYLDPGSGPGRVALRALAGVALYGGGLGIDIILRVTGDEMSTESALETLVDGGILTVTGERQEYGFAQEMVRQAVLNLARQRPWFHRFHRALLDALAESPGAPSDAAFLALGYDKLGATEQARTWLARAIEARIAAGLFGEAAELGDRLSALTIEPVARAGIELDIVRALIQGRKFEDAKRRLLRLETRGAHRGSGPEEIRRRIYRLDIARGLYEAGVEDPTLLADADALSDVTLCCEARMALASVAPEERAMSLAGDAVALAERCGPALEFKARVLRFERTYESSRCDFQLAQEDLSRALEIAAAMSSPWQQIHIEGDLAALEAELGQTEAAIDRMRRLAEKAEALGMRGQLRLFSQNISALLLRDGRPDEAAEAALRTADLAAEAGDPVLRATALSLRADALRRMGNLEGALMCADKAEQLQGERGDRMRALTLLRRAEILYEMDRLADGLNDARKARQVADEQGERDFAIRAALWEALHRVRQGSATTDELKQVLAEATAPGPTLRSPTVSLMAQAREWLATASEMERR